jgi:EAL and modified HD-GYP domain-containing signal transduction protein
LDDVDFYTAEIEGFLPNVDIVKIDWSLIPANARGKVVSRFKEAGKQVLAEKVEHREDFDEALRTGCDLIQGFYFSKPEVLAGREILPSVGFVLRIIQQLLDDAPLNDIVQSLNQAPIVATQLLRLANSGAMPNGRGLQFASLHQALAMVGSAKLLQWCSLVLYANPNGLPSFDDPLLHLAEQRARFMEQTAKQRYLNDAWLNQAAYLTGMLSLLHVPHGVDVLTFLKDLPLDYAIKSAISYRVGYLGELISLAEHWERAGQGACPR